MTRPSASTTVKPEHHLTHGAVTHRGRARRACGRHPADRGVGAGIDREEDAAVGERLVQLTMRNARFDLAIEVVDADTQDAVHTRQIDRNTTMHGIDVTLERRAHAKRHDRRTMPSRDRDDCRHLFGGRRKHHDVGRAGACHDSPWLWCSICVGFVAAAIAEQTAADPRRAQRVRSRLSGCMSDVLSVLRQVKGVQFPFTQNPLVPARAETQQRP